MARLPSLDFAARWDGHHWRVYQIWTDPLTRRWRSYCLPNRYKQWWRVLREFENADTLMFFLPLGKLGKPNG